VCEVLRELVVMKQQKKQARAQERRVSDEYFLIHNLNIGKRMQEKL
jgi:adenine C2-methylase RlmN of 23S rRNA A2503 and tRNA A37